MKNYVQPGRTVAVTAPYARLSGEAVQVGAALFGVCVNDIGNGQEGEIVVESGIYDLAKTAGAQWDPGDKLYWDNATKSLTKTVSTNLYVGQAVAPVALSAATTGRVRLNGSY